MRATASSRRSALSGQDHQRREARLAKVLSNQEIQSHHPAIGAKHLAEDFNLDNAPLPQDRGQDGPDVDGAHIRTLIYVLLPPHVARTWSTPASCTSRSAASYRIQDGRTERYCGKTRFASSRKMNASPKLAQSRSDRYGPSRCSRSTATALAGALREYDGWAARCVTSRSSPAVDYGKGPRMVEGAARDARPARSYFTTACGRRAQQAVEVVAATTTRRRSVHDVRGSPRRERTGCASRPVPMPEAMLRSPGLPGLRRSHLKRCARSRGTALRAQARRAHARRAPSEGVARRHPRAGEGRPPREPQALQGTR